MNLAELHRLGRRLTAAAASAMKGASDPGSTELLVLECLFTAGPQPVGAIAQHTGFAQSRVSTVVAALHKRGLVELGTDPADRRRTVAKIAEHARTQARQARSRDAEPTLRQMLPGLPDAELDAMIAALRTLHGALGEAAPDPSSGTDL
ncbi:MarR family winged helix-turn-helix transcriptional regulator [Streptomyces inhibens]|uniref:MarR family winged helix-turn-helix transcriptional regulator n=1 Tax=Streptomyces inhibens TaxID=2293571 RepID=UPI001EE76296|nr:MarR family transcriptional regulator [Streptomyces inhibens]UKY48951.1 MarR family transcriptional regulator [Streptomyces inhibens]